VNEVKRPADAAGDTLRPQVRILAAGAVVGVVLLGAAVVIDLAGLNDPRTPQLPVPDSTSAPRVPSVPSLPPGLPSGVPTDLPTTLPSFPTGLPDMPTMPNMPTVPGGAP
jgi:hypothetical protein